MAQFNFKDVKNIYINGNKVDSFVLNGARVWPAPLPPVVESCSLSRNLDKFYLNYTISNPNEYNVTLYY
ncbi:MAG: hypothetical protein J1F36_01595, partial [Clostridiales bacterium]|nr:hypothetical protein [Clostridiales bacterium]